MIPSIAGLLVSALLLLLGYILGAPLIIGLFASLPFGSTAFATLSGLGGSSPLIYTLFCLGIISVIVLRRRLLRDLAIVFTQFPSAWIVIILTAYAIVSAMIFPRLFAGQTTAFIPVEGVVTELPLSPISGNITQTAYFALGALTFIALSVLLLREENLKAVRRGFFAFIIINAILGIIDLAGKVTGVGDVLLPIRTASYAFLVEVEQGGFWRIAGGFSEASAFGGTSLACLSFAYVYWRQARSVFAFGVTVVMLLLVLLSTSSAAYAGLAILCLAPLASLARSAIRNRFRSDDLLLIALGAIAIIGLLSIYLYNDKLFQPVTELIETTILDKAQSQSAIERSYWNERSLQSFVETAGVGIGMGSSRSSSWIVSVLSQLGVLGTLAMLSLVAVTFRGMRGLPRAPDTVEIFALASAARASGAATLLARCIAGSSADPSMIFFLSLATVVACRYHVSTRQQPSRPPLRTLLVQQQPSRI